MESLQRLTELEKIIDRGLKTFYEVGKALNEIRESKLYKQDYSTFDDYCRERWGIQRMQAYRYIESAEVQDNVSHVIQNQRQALELAKAEPEQQAEIYQAVIEKTGGKPTAKAIREQIESVQSVQDVLEPEIVETYNIEYNIRCVGIESLVHKIFKQSMEDWDIINEILKEIRRYKNKR